MPETTDVLEWRGRTAVGADGQVLGTIEQIYLDTETERPEWVLIHTGTFARKSSFMPLDGSTSEGDQVRAPFNRDQVEDDRVGVGLRASQGPVEPGHREDVELPAYHDANRFPCGKAPTREGSWQTRVRAAIHPPGLPLTASLPNPAAS